MEEKKEECKSCCGPRCGCCGCMAIKALILLLVGGLIGFFMARHCGHRGYCPMMSDHSAYNMPAPETPAPTATPAAKAKKK